MLELKNITKIFNADTVNEKVALDDLSLILNDGDFVTIIGGDNLQYGGCKFFRELYRVDFIHVDAYYHQL